jgi:alpha-D-ribose 1-methylphosphonate 5-triphosphate synthase subunit PhnI
MGYVAARGGTEAIRAAEALIARLRERTRSPRISTDQIEEQLRLAVDRVMGEGALWAPGLAARAIRQVEGDLLEAAQLLRAHRSALPRIARSVPVDADSMVVLRRIVPAYRTPPGPQLLGRTLDYVGRVLEPAAASTAHDPPDETTIDAGTAALEPADRSPMRLLDVLRDADLAVDHRPAGVGNTPPSDPEPFDIARGAVRPGVPRSARLSVMARAETGALVQLWYRNILGPDNHLHEVTLGEVRHGWLGVPVVHPDTGGAVTLGRIRVTEVEAIEDLNGVTEDRARFDVGYGLCAGHNERKAIAMANLDIAVRRDLDAHPGQPSALEQSVLMTTDGLDASGFLEHLKLPHYVTFRSMVERKQAIRDAGVAATAVVR